MVIVVTAFWNRTWHMGHLGYEDWQLQYTTRSKSKSSFGKHGPLRFNKKPYVYRFDCFFWFWRALFTSVHESHGIFPASSRFTSKNKYGREIYDETIWSDLCTL